MATKDYTAVPVNMDLDTPTSKGYPNASSIYRSVRSFVTFRRLFAYQVLMFTLLGMLMLTGTVEYGAGPGFASSGPSSEFLSKRWGYYSQMPQSFECYKSERKAWLLAVFLGTLGVDQWYAHHWILAVFKLLTAGGFGIWSFVDVILWGLGGIYCTPGCPGGYHGPGGGGP